MNLALGLSSPHSARSSGSSRTDSRLGASWGPSGLQLWMQKTPDEAIPQGTMWGGGAEEPLECRAWRKDNIPAEQISSHCVTLTVDWTVKIKF